MKLKSLLLISLLLYRGLLAAQDESGNITIQEQKDEYRFVKGDQANPVWIKQELNTKYYCNSYRTSIPISEFYSSKVVINDVAKAINGGKLNSFTATDEYYSVDGIFFSDTRVNYFYLALDQKGNTGQVRYQKTYLDPRYFTNIFFPESYAIDKKTVTLIVPDWMNIEIREFNFKGYSIKTAKERKGQEMVYTYSLTNVPASPDESNAPGPTYTQPHILVMCKSASPDGQTLTYFNTLADQYKWYRSLLLETGNDAAVLKAKAEELTKGMTDDLQKVKAIYQWVMDNVRYIAYEDGIAGFKPDKAQEVLRKKYGDCKGMGNLMAGMLKSINLDGRVCWLGTNHIAYDYSTPSLSVDNHVICAWIHKGKTYFLDATEKYIGFGETAERIQGRQVLIEDGEKYMLQTIPVQPETQNTAIEKRTLHIAGNNLEGKVVQIWKGESKEWLLSQLHDIRKENQIASLSRFLADGKSNYKISNLKISNFDDYNKDIQLEYDLQIKDGAVSFDKETYIDLDDRKDMGDAKFDLEKRKLPYEFPYKIHKVYEVELQLPPGMKLGTAIAPLKIEQPEYAFAADYKTENGKVTYRRDLRLRKTRFTVDQLQHWNKDIASLSEFYNTQLSLTK